MSLHFQREVERLKKQLLEMSAYVEEDLALAIKAARARDRDVAERVISADRVINAMEIDVEEECLKILALHQPVAGDLRMIISVLKMNGELERIGDLAKNIAERAVMLADGAPVTFPDTIGEMEMHALRMVKGSLDALVNVDAGLAREVLDLDDTVDALNRDTFLRVRDQMQAAPHLIEELLNILSVSRYLERIADHATNIAEDVIYLIEGDIIRHKL